MTNKLSPLAFGIACGVLAAFYVFFAGVFAIYGWGNLMVDVVASFYVGYGASFVGALIGGVWAFVDGFVAGTVIAWIYNKIV